MPLDRYYGGHGESVMKSMQKQYGAKKGKQVFYATANRQKSAKKKSVRIKRKKSGY